MMQDKSGPIRPTTPEGVRANLLHEHKVERIAHQLRHRQSTAPLSRQKRSVSHQVPKVRDHKHTDEKIDLRDFDQVIEIDPERKICIAEPGIAFCDLVEKTLAHGLVPIVVPELKSITIGGAVAGCSIESMSFQYGGFHDACLEYEIITAKGDVLVCTPDNEHSLIFHMMHGSFGTVGILSRLVFKLIDAKPFVHIRHDKYTSIDAYLEAIQRHAELRDVDFMDGIIHSNTQLTLCVGDFVDTAPYTHSYDWWRVYYRSTATRSEDYFTTPNYFFRYDHGVTNVHPKSFLARVLLGKFLGSSQILRIAEKGRWLLFNDDRPDVTVDTFLPISNTKEFLLWIEKKLGRTPLWCVPFRPGQKYEWIHDGVWANFQNELMIDIAIYGMKQTQNFNYYRAIEEKLTELNGVKTLISYNYYSEEEFWKIFHKDNFDAVKRITDPNNIFRTLYEKTSRPPK